MSLRFFMLLLFLIVVDRPIHEASLLPTDQNAATCKSLISLGLSWKKVGPIGPSNLNFYEKG